MPEYAGVLFGIATLMVGTRLWLRATKRSGGLGVDDVSKICLRRIDMNEADCIPGLSDLLMDWAHLVHDTGYPRVREIHDIPTHLGRANRVLLQNGRNRVDRRARLSCLRMSGEDLRPFVLQKTCA